MIDCVVDASPPPDWPFHSRSRSPALSQQAGALAIRSRKPSPSTSVYENTGERALPLAPRPMLVTSTDEYVNVGLVEHFSGAGAAGTGVGCGEASVQLLRNTRIVPPLSLEL